MAVHGYVTHARRNQRLTGLLVLGYVLAFELIGAFVLTPALLFFDPQHIILADPSGYLLRYGLPVAVASGLLFRWLYRDHARAVCSALAVQLVTRIDEPRFVTIAEEVCTTLGIRRPRFGVVEVPALNALSVGEGPVRGMIVATRGLLNALDDDELATVLAHEASHIRQGDTQLLAANHALMRTAVMLQVSNPFRFEDWRQIILPLLMPPLLLVMLAGGAVTMAAITLARWARQGLSLGRDHAADGEAVRVTHFPEALLSALVKIDGHGVFPGSRRVEGSLFAIPADRDGDRRPSLAARRKAIAALGRDLMDSARLRRDTREPASSRSGNRGPNRALYPTDLQGRPLVQPPTATLTLSLKRFTDPEGYRQWQEASVAWHEWRLSDRRNMLGLAPKMVIPVAATAMFLAVFWWPSDNELGKLAKTFGPGAIVEMAQEVNSGPSCRGPSIGSDGLCPDYRYTSAQFAVKKRMMARLDAEDKAARRTPEERVDNGLMLVPLLLFGLIGLAIFKPGALRRLFGVVEAAPAMSNPAVAKHTAIGGPEPLASNQSTITPGGFGRKRSS